MNLNILNLSDIHLCHGNNETLNIIDNLMYFFREHNERFKTLDMISITGDVYHKLVPSYSEDGINSSKWLAWLVRYCVEYNIKLRILEGTQSHDWGQVSNLYTVVKKLNLDIDFKYMDKVTLEYIEDWDKYIMYIPDEVNHDSSITLKYVKSLMEKKGLDKVDMFMMHGFFNYQLPVFKIYGHNEREYLRLVKDYIFIGHVHTYSNYGKIYCPGSFDRLQHGEEEKKGALFVNLNPYGNRVEFLENKKAKVFKTIFLKTMKINVAMKEIRSVGKRYLNPVVKLKIKETNPLIDEIGSILDNFNFKITIEKIIDEDKLIEKIEVESKFKDLIITKNNIENLLLEEMIKHNLNIEEVNVLKSELRKVI